MNLPLARLVFLAAGLYHLGVDPPRAVRTGMRTSSRSVMATDTTERIVQAPVRIGLEATDDEAAIRETAEALRGSSGILEFDAFVDAVLRRQRVEPPLLGHGIALPHARTEAVRDIVTAFGVARHDVPFGPDRTPVRLVVLVGTPPGRASEYLAWVADLVQRFRDARVRDALAAAPDAEAFVRVLAG